MQSQPRHKGAHKIKGQAVNLRLYKSEEWLLLHGWVLTGQEHEGALGVFEVIYILI